MWWKLGIGTISLLGALGYAGILIWWLIDESACEQFAICRNFAEEIRNPDPREFILTLTAAIIGVIAGASLVRRAFRRQD